MIFLNDEFLEASFVIEIFQNPQTIFRRNNFVIFAVKEQSRYFTGFDCFSHVNRKWVEGMWLKVVF